MKQGATRSRKRLSRGEKIIRDRAMVNSVLRVCRHWRYATAGKADPDGLRLVKGHYSRRKPNSKQFMPPGETIVLVTEARDAVWGWWRPHPGSGIVAMNGRDGWTCSVFANHGGALSSELVLDAERALKALTDAGLTAAPCGPSGMLSYVWRARVKSKNPGHCYKVAGWKKIETCARGTKDLLWKPFELAGVKMEKLEFTEIKGERSRVYTFPGKTIRVENVTKLCVRPSGTHRLETASGQKFIIAANWLSIAVDADAWSA